MADVHAFFRTNPTPIHFVGPTAFNLLGLDRWVRSLDDTEFLQVAPLLRRSFGGFSPAERGNLLRATQGLSGGAARAGVPDIDLSRADGVLVTARLLLRGAS